MKKSLIVGLVFAIGACSPKHDVVTPTNSIDSSPSSNSHLVEQYQPGIKGEEVVIGTGNRKMTFVKKGDYYSIGDMIYSKDAFNRHKSYLNSDKGARTGRADFWTLWPGAVVYYTINSALPDQWRVTDAISHWQNTTSVRFVQRTNQSDYVEFVVGGGCSSEIGRTGGRQIITLASACTTGNTIHEIGHALGLIHEHQRTDRDNFITVNYGNVSQVPVNNYFPYPQVYSFPGFQYGQLDFGSIMMYSSTEYPGGPVVISRTDGSTFSSQRTALSGGDIETINRMYFSPYASIYVELASDLSDGPVQEYIYNVYVRFYSDAQKTIPRAVAANTTFNYRFQRREDSGVYNTNSSINVPGGTQSQYIGQAHSRQEYNQYGEVVNNGGNFSEAITLNASPDLQYRY